MKPEAKKKLREIVAKKREELQNKREATKERMNKAQTKKEK